MVLIGLLLVLVAIAAAVLLVMGALPLDTTATLEPSIFKFELTPLALLIAGAAIMLLLWLGLGMIRGSMKRRRRPGREAKEAQRRAELEESIRADERARADETHQGALAERDRLHDEDLQTKLTERDRQRDDEFRSREREIEDRVRAEERTKLEREFAGRHATSGAPVAAGVAGAGAGAGAAYADREHSSRAQDGSADERLYTQDDRTRDDLTHGDVARDGATRDDLGRHDSTREDLVRDEDRDGADRADGTHVADDGTPIGEHDPAQQEHRPVHRTMADKLMGRDPERRD
ncbi:hypothetical protein [Pedococcus sp. 2YAF34]|uniref:hypothetical protein n=1 Tax=Pedococcus sp. 2YAF34 TaxID=3233032 RepID=UPI003F9D2E82